LHNDLLTEPARFSPPFAAFAVAAPAFGICNAPIPYSVADVIAVQPTPDPDFAAPLNSAGALSLCRFSPDFIDPRLKSPYVEEWNLTLQSEVARDWVLEVGYVGNEGHRISFGQDPNHNPASPDPQQCESSESKPFVGVLPQYKHEFLVQRRNGSDQAPFHSRILGALSTLIGETALR